MRRSTLIRCAALVAVALVGPFFQSACAQAFSSDVVGTGTLVAWLSGLEFHATIEGEIQLTGDAALDGDALSFTAEGGFRGFGIRGITTLVSEGWIGYAAAGKTDDGEPIEIRGLLYAWWKSLIPLQAGEVFVGTHCTVLLFKGETRSYCGEFSGTAAGDLEPAETPMTIQFGGTGTVLLEGEEGPPDARPPAAIPLDHPALPLEFLQYVAGLDLDV